MLTHGNRDRHVESLIEELMSTGNLSSMITILTAINGRHPLSTYRHRTFSAFEHIGLQPWTPWPVAVDTSCPQLPPDDVPKLADIPLLTLEGTLIYPLPMPW